ncbi:hypothetical protein [Streptomyces sp. NPDC020362]|uniref:hypothetical protein n=1 Tax=unclassified Streptomyces TaxID=2593676 RepID=UPI0033DC4CCF
MTTRPYRVVSLPDTRLASPPATRMAGPAGFSVFHGEDSVEPSKSQRPGDSSELPQAQARAEDLGLDGLPGRGGELRQGTDGRTFLPTASAMVSEPTGIPSCLPSASPTLVTPTRK